MHRLRDPDHVDTDGDGIVDSQDHDLTDKDDNIDCLCRLPVLTSLRKSGRGASSGRPWAMCAELAGIAKTPTGHLCVRSGAPGHTLSGHLHEVPAGQLRAVGLGEKVLRGRKAMVGASFEMLLGLSGVNDAVPKPPNKGTGGTGKLVVEELH
uniref:Uncharacterized protein n=1 Tax=Timema monikensis TaxID=170555 RepID=A0A7R9HU26_9NEOP|nr:unnamed protein product [Timema monikensis]